MPTPVLSVLPWDATHFLLRSNYNGNAFLSLCFFRERHYSHLHWKYKMPFKRKGITQNVCFPPSYYFYYYFSQVLWKGEQHQGLISRMRKVRGKVIVRIRKCMYPPLPPHTHVCMCVHPRSSNRHSFLTLRMNIFWTSAMNFCHTAFQQVISKVSEFVWSPLCKMTQQ